MERDDDAPRICPERDEEADVTEAMIVDVAVAIRASVLALMLVSMSVASVPNDVKVRVPYVQISAAVTPPLPTVLTGTFRLSTINLPIDPTVKKVDVAAFHTSAAEISFNALISPVSDVEALKILVLVRAIAAPSDDEAEAS